MDKKDCIFPEFLKDGDPNKCSPEQMCICHKKSGGKHPLPEEGCEEEQKDK